MTSEVIHSKLTKPGEQILKELHQLRQNQTGYKSWGAVTVSQIGVRMTNDQWLQINFSGDEIAENHPPISISNIESNIQSFIFKKRKKINTILITRQENASRVNQNIPPILDDQAQLLGPSLRHIKEADNVKKILAGLSGRYAVNLGDGRTICIGKNLEEAFIAAQLVEKTSKAFLEAKHLGGAKSINRFEAWAMHKFYMLKYSKESERNR